MSRLTKRINNETVVYTLGKYEDTTAGEMESSDTRTVLRALAKYEDLEEQCVKDNMFGLHELCEKWKAFYEDIVELLDYRKKQEQGLLLELKVPLGTRIWWLEEDFHDGTVEISTGFYDLKWLHFHKDEDFYLTRSKAEEALAKMGE